MARFADFDAAFQEADKNREPLRIRLFGQDWELPAEMPAAPVLKVARWMADGRSQESLTAAELLDLARDLVPDETLKAWGAKGLSVEQLGPIVQWVIEEYMKDSPGAAPGEALAPQPEGPGSSSTDGPSLKPISSVSTDSPSPKTYSF